MKRSRNYVAKFEDGFGNRLKRLRKSADLTAEAVGTALGVSRTTIFKYESELAVPGAETLARLAAIYGASEEFILTGSNSEPKIEVLHDFQVACKLANLYLEKDEQAALAKIMIDFMQNNRGSASILKN